MWPRLVYVSMFVCIRVFNSPVDNIKEYDIHFLLA